MQGNRLYVCGTNAHNPKDYVIYVSINSNKVCAAILYSSYIQMNMLCSVPRWILEAKIQMMVVVAKANKPAKLFHKPIPYGTTRTKLCVCVCVCFFPVQHTFEILKILSIFFLENIWVFCPSWNFTLFLLKLKISKKKDIERHIVCCDNMLLPQLRLLLLILPHSCYQKRKAFRK